MKPLVLASTSPYRRKLMDQLAVPYVAAAPEEEEDHQLELPTEEFVQELARRKALSLAAKFPEALIIGADQVAEIDGERLFKPMTPARAKAQLRRLAGRTHRLVTGLVVHEPETGRTEAALDVQRMTLRSLSEEAIAAYVEADAPVDCAGAYKVEGAGIALFASMRGDDFTGIIGLPLTKVVDLLERFGVDVLTARSSA
ncbi:MAG: septum formation protein Maf [Deltaproteobacteria bacterium]|jgi:septum formation protein|nr:septum formation protein Maf [Deltaproteobacteria bacterium]MBW2532134.1 septum formation protein Maf [Deltaproteobacteria bacterium]